MSAEAQSEDCPNDEAQITEQTDDDDLEVDADAEPYDEGSAEAPDEEHAGDEEAADTGEEGFVKGTKAFAVSSNKKLTSRFRGVCWNKKNKRWQAAINSSGRYLYLGSYASEQEAAKAFDKAALRIRGKKARLNYRYCDYVDSAGNLLEDKHIDVLLEQANDPARHRRRVSRKSKVSTISVPEELNKLEHPAPPPTETGLQAAVVGLRPNFLENLYAYPHMQALQPYPGSAFTLFNGMQGAMPALAALSGAGFDAMSAYQQQAQAQAQVNAQAQAQAQAAAQAPSQLLLQKPELATAALLKQSLGAGCSGSGQAESFIDPQQRFSTMVSLDAFQRGMLFQQSVPAQFTAPQYVTSRSSSEPPQPQAAAPAQSAPKSSEQPSRISDFNLIRQHLPEGATLDSLVPGDDNYVGVLYSVEGSTKIAGAVFDGTALRSMGLFDTEKDAKQACQSSIGLLSEMKSKFAQLQSPEDKQPATLPPATAKPAVQQTIPQGYQVLNPASYLPSTLTMTQQPKSDHRGNQLGYDRKEAELLFSRVPKFSPQASSQSADRRFPLDFSELKQLEATSRSPQNVAAVRSAQKNEPVSDAGPSGTARAAAENGRAQETPSDTPTNWNLGNLAAVLDPNVLSDNSEYVLVPSQYYPVLHSKQLLENLVFIQQQSGQANPSVDAFKPETSEKSTAVPYPVVHPGGAFRVEHLLISPWGNLGAQSSDQTGAAAMANAAVTLAKHVQELSNTSGGPQVHEVTDESSQNPPKLDESGGLTMDTSKRKYGEDSGSSRSKKGKTQMDGYKQIQELKEITVQQALEVYKAYGRQPFPTTFQRP